MSLEVSGGGDREEMIRQGQKLFAKFNPEAGNVWIKIPIDPSLSGESQRHFVCPPAWPSNARPQYCFRNLGENCRKQS